MSTTRTGPILAAIVVSQLLHAQPADAESATPNGAETTAQIREKLKALDAARAAGILSDDEYDRKKAELEARLAAAAAPPIDAETQRKLKALDAARAAGILSEEERYDAAEQGVSFIFFPPTTS